ncbi:MAG: hypothetical protein WBJ13_14250 [Sedimentibacter sp.]
MILGLPIFTFFVIFILWPGASVVTIIYAMFHKESDLDYDEPVKLEKEVK